ncbi:hypothetical protein BX661DRAFT_89534 [Kickxella alabastrina]|uniref:uncharacterized protein n=1 Tax=Kickxella alabastrina TaxID=61397 RepID=UPI0022206122|nr:uncharacterized protein BX661DRAFT_89534 [Kickxella alabastrina]KAI7830814.1 hypothetical protein BX661DRAFT_89534 [Kickxella alabastrina]
MALDHRLRLLSLDHMESPLSVPCDPDAYPKWLQNAMRGYWKLACRPFIPSGIKSHMSKRHKRVPSHLASSTNGATISTQSTHTMGGVAGSASTTSQISDHMDAASSVVASKQLSNSVGGMEFSAHSFAPNGIGENAHQININALTNYTDASLATQASFLNSSTHQPAASNDISSLPLLEALLSGPNSALPQPQPPMPPPQQQQQPPMLESAPATMSSRLSGLRPPPQPMVPTHSAPADDILLMPSKRTYDVSTPLPALQQPSSGRSNRHSNHRSSSHRCPFTAMATLIRIYHPCITRRSTLACRRTSACDTPHPPLLLLTRTAQ